MSGRSPRRQRREQHQLDQLLEAVLASAKYRHIDSDFIRDIGMQELAKRHHLKEAIKATKNKLHQVAGAYLEEIPRYPSWLNELKQASRSGNKDQLLAVCRSIMSHHASTRERLPLLEQFYTTILDRIAPVNSVIDVACGLNPLAIPWMPLAEQAEYYAYDIYQDMMDFLNEGIPLLGVQGHAQVCDVIHYSPAHRAGVAFLLKAIPCLEQVDKSAGQRLLETINADHLVVSFPAHSLGGRKKGMVLNYEAHFEELVANKGWSIKRFEFPGELAFLITR